MATRGANQPIPTIEICKPDGSNKRIVNQKDFVGLYRQKGYITLPAWKKANAVQRTDAEMKAQEAVEGLIKDADGDAPAVTEGGAPAIPQLSNTPPNPNDTHPNGKDPIDDNPPANPISGSPPPGGR